MISEKEFEVINILASHASSTQRQLASKTQMSLGMVNVLLKRLVTKGYLRAQQLDRRKVEFILTRQGLAEKAQKSYRYALKTISSFKLIRLALMEVLKNSYETGMRQFLILGDGDFAHLVESILSDQMPADVTFERVTKVPAHVAANTLLLLTDEQASVNGVQLPILNLINSLEKAMIPPKETVFRE